MKWHTLSLCSQLHHLTRLMCSLRLIWSICVRKFFLKYLPVPHVLYFLFLEVNLNRSSAPLDEPKPLVGLSSSSACGSPLEALPDNLLLPLELLLLSGSLHCKGKWPKQSNFLADVTQNICKDSNTNRTHDRTHWIHFGWKFDFKSVCFTQVPVTKTHIVDSLVVDRANGAQVTHHLLLV